MRIRLLHLPVLGPPERLPRGPFVNIMPVGLIALADRLDRLGHEVQVWHAGVEHRIDPEFALAEVLAGERVDLVGLSLHWHHQIPVVEEAGRVIRSALPGARIVAGGMTASWFADELLREWPWLDGVLRGEAEDSLAELAAFWGAGEGRASAIPGFSWRGDGRIVHNPPGAAAERDALDSLDFARLDLLRHADAYNAQFAAVDGRFDNPPVFYLCPGRGCSRSCAFCGGGQGAHQVLSGRSEVVFRSPAVVAGEVERMVGRGVRDFCVCFDPPPASAGFYEALFADLRRRRLEIGMVFECYQPPEERFLSDFRRTFVPDRSRLSLSPTVADEDLRGWILSGGYPNREVERFLAGCQQRDLPATLYFASLPQESASQLEASLIWQAELVSRYGCRLVHSSLEVEPGAPWCQAPNEYDLTRVRTDFAEYRARHFGLGLGMSAAAEVGYGFSDLDTRLVRIRSAVADPGRDLAQALGGCGLETNERILMVGSGRLDEALALVPTWRGQVCRVHLAGGDDLRSDAATLGRLAEKLGPAARLSPFQPQRVVHRRWHGERPTTPGADPVALQVLHLADDPAASAALAWLEAEPGSSPPGWVLADACRWLPGRCPAMEVRLLALAADGSRRACSSCPPLAGRTAVELAAEVAAQRDRVEERRGCAVCPVRETCCRCPFLGGLSETAYCELRRNLGSAGLGAFGWAMLQAPRAPAIGWDD